MAKEHYRAEDLTEPFYFNRPTEVSDGEGGFTTSMVRNPVSGFHKAKVRPLRGGERQVGDAVSSTSEVLFVVRKALGILPTDTLVLGGVNYNIRRVSPALSRTSFQEIEAEYGVVND